MSAAKYVQWCAICVKRNVCYPSKNDESLLGEKATSKSGGLRSNKVQSFYEVKLTTSMLSDFSGINKGAARRGTDMGLTTLAPESASIKPVAIAGECIDSNSSPPAAAVIRRHTDRTSSSNELHSACISTGIANQVIMVIAFPAV